MLEAAMADQTAVFSHRWITGWTGSAFRAVAIGAATAAGFCYAPIASADPEPSTQQEPAENQQDEQQQQGFSPPRLDTPNTNSANNPSDASKNGDLADIHCWMYSTGPEWFPPGAMPRPGLPGEQVWPCYYVAGLTPH
ncbi:hypothetical protein A5735_13240 [Mycolicibacter heraklionensis]|nr:hypothetical protein A5735_13240 [Mycolicibacter heraklionensis]